MADKNRILLINDDEPISRYLGERLISGAGYSVVFEYTCEGGLAALKQSNFDIVIGKFGMPDLDGVSLVRSIKKIDPDNIIIAFIEEEDPLLLKGIAVLGVSVPEEGRQITAGQVRIDGGAPHGVVSLI